MISIVIPNYNGSKYLKNCLDSIGRQKYKEYEVIIIDNASTDDDYEWVKQKSEFVFKRLEKNYGFSKAVNEGIRLAKGEYVLLLNNDTELEIDFLENIIIAIKKDSNIFAVSSKMIQYYNRDLIDDAGDGYMLAGWAYKRGDGKSIADFNIEERVFSACAGAALYKRSVFDKIGYFDEKFFAYLEDMDISYRANIYGYKIVYCPSAKVYHVGSATSGGRYSSFKIRISARNSVYVAYKNMPFLQLIINLPLLVLGMIVKQRVFARKGYGKVYKEGLIEGIRSLKNIKKIPFEIRHLPYYLHIQWMLIRNTFKYFMLKIK